MEYFAPADRRITPQAQGAKVREQGAKVREQCAKVREQCAKVRPVPAQSGAVCVMLQQHVTTTTTTDQIRTSKTQCNNHYIYIYINNLRKVCTQWCANISLHKGTNLTKTCPCATCNWLLHPAPTSAHNGLDPL